MSRFVESLLPLFDKCLADVNFEIVPNTTEIINKGEYDSYVLLLAQQKDNNGKILAKTYVEFHDHYVNNLNVNWFKFVCENTINRSVLFDWFQEIADNSIYMITTYDPDVLNLSYTEFVDRYGSENQYSR